ncbi:MAG TPA: J domain-containing protein [Bacillales bacterium]|nr:J domain-containing protein [Bacillales bacterium]
MDGNADQQAVKKRYRKLMALLHPDRGGDAHLFDLVKKAYDELAV